MAGPNLLNPLKVAGFFVIHVADFLDGPTPRLANIKDFKPGGDAFYEASCFTPDSKSLLFTSDFDTKNFWKNQIYRLDLETGAARRLTHDQGYNEHPSLTPDGKSILWMSDVQCDTLGLLHGTDWWLMDADGANPRRVSTMNVRNSPQCDGKPKWACVAAWSPDGRWFLGDVEMNLFDVCQQGGSRGPAARRCRRSTRGRRAAAPTIAPARASRPCGSRRARFPAGSRERRTTCAFTRGFPLPPRRWASCAGGRRKPSSRGKACGPARSLAPPARSPK